MKSEPQRIVSLLPAATEILHFLGETDRLVGVSDDCDWPPSIRNLPSVSVSQIDDSQPSGAIDEQVREQAHAGRSLYHVDEDLLEELDPDLVVTQEQCDVCAPSFDDVRDSCRRLSGDRTILSLEPYDLDDVLETIEVLGEATGRTGQAEELIDNLRGRQQHVDTITGEVNWTPRVSCLEWLDPLFVGGHWVPEMVEAAGGRPLGEPGEHSHEIGWGDIVDQDPDVLVLMPCGFETGRAVREGGSFLSEQRNAGGAFPEGLRTYAVNGSYYFSRPGPRLWEGLSLLAFLQHPGLAHRLEVPSEAFGHLT
jgi:iron complex transport system substrate-binding protein